MDIPTPDVSSTSTTEYGSWAHVQLVSMMESPEGVNQDKGSGETHRDEEWGDSSRLLFQSGYLKVIKAMALSGHLQQYNIRSICWRLFLGCLPEDRNKWVEVTQKSRDIFTAIKKRHIIDPHNIETGKDLVVHNPLSLAGDSPWNQYFQDNDLKQLVNQDVVRTFPEVDFFRQPHIQKMLLELLFCYSRENEDLGYRQGMHEILAPILFVLHAELRDKEDTSLAPIVQMVMDSDFIEHDAYTIFSELMESMSPWYMSTALEADFYKARSQSKKKMAHDPRTNKPFEDKGDFSPTSAISRKLDVIHNLHLKNADELLDIHLKELSIPSQTYGIRWIRLLFGREFPLPTMLELWDALFADGPSLGLVDYMCVAMLMHIRNVLIEGDYSACMQHLMHFPPVYEVNYLVQRALHIRSPSSFPSPRLWSYHPSVKGNTYQNLTSGNNSAFSHSLRLQSTDTTGNMEESSNTERTSKASKTSTKALEMFNKQIPKAFSGSRSSRTTSGPKLEFYSNSRSRSPSPSSHMGFPLPILDHPLLVPEMTTHHQRGRSPVRVTDSNKQKGRGKIIGTVKNKHQTSGKEMSENPKSTSQKDVSLTKVEKLKNRIDDLQAKCLYCGGKADSLITAMQEEIIKLEGLPPETENTLLLSLAGLKQVRDLLLSKIPFTGEVLQGWEATQSKSTTSLEDSDPVTDTNGEGHPRSSSGDPALHGVDKNSSDGHRPSNITAKGATEADRTNIFSVPMAFQASVEEIGTEVLGDGKNIEVGTSVLSGGMAGVKESKDDGSSEDWISLSASTHPLLRSSD